MIDTLLELFPLTMLTIVILIASCSILTGCEHTVHVSCPLFHWIVSVDPFLEIPYTQPLYMYCTLYQLYPLWVYLHVDLHLS